MPVRTLTAAMLLLLATGCQRTNSFLQMDSNSRSPFLGLQLSVDAKDQKVDIPSARQDHSGQIVNVKNESSANGSIGDQEVVVDLSSNESSPANDKSWKLSLPKLNLAQNPRDAAEIDEILDRI